MAKEDSIGKDGLEDYLQGVEEVFDSIDIESDLTWSDAKNKGQQTVKGYCDAFLANVRNDLKDKKNIDADITERDIRNKIHEIIEGRVEETVGIFDADVSQHLDDPELFSKVVREAYIGKLGSIIGEGVLLLVDDAFEAPQAAIVPEEPQADIIPEKTQAQIDQEKWNKVSNELDLFMWRRNRGGSDPDPDDGPSL